jgi:hypothetical protein
MYGKFCTYFTFYAMHTGMPELKFIFIYYPYFLFCLFCSDYIIIFLQQSWKCQYTTRIFSAWGVFHSEKIITSVPT